eukprot:Ihof_evm1s319 gene=Ihof_evmTU1s319
MARYNTGFGVMHGRLGRYISHYEPLSMNVLHQERQHRRKRRQHRKGADADILEIQLNAFDRLFHLSLQHIGLSVSPAYIVTHNGTWPIDTSDLPVYEGHVVGENDSYVRGRIFNGIFEGSLHIKHGTYHIENSHKFKTMYQNPQLQIHNAIMYRLSDIEIGVDGGKRRICETKSNQPTRSSGRKHTIDSNTPHPNPNHNFFHRDYPNKNQHNLNKRESSTISGTQNTCMVDVVADQTYYAMMGGIAQTIGAMDYLIDRVNAIYNSTQFFPFSNVHVNIAPQSFLVYTDTSKENPLRDTTKSVTDTLIDFSKPRWDGVCLAHLLTYRDFANGVLGLAWTADADVNGDAGGICQRRISSTDGLLNLNTGISTSYNYGTAVPEAVFIATIAHEIGHGFGAQHDGLSCMPQNSDEQYIMAAKETTNNNLKFSNCSITTMEEVMISKASCFVKYPKAVCGNGKRENDEECDCGDNCDAQSCCTTDCKIVNQCSPLVGGCCTTDCMYTAANWTCSGEQSCMKAATCTGQSAQCPTPMNKPRDSLCGNKAFLCMGDGKYGKCQSTLFLSTTTSYVVPAYYPGVYPCSKNGIGHCDGAGLCIREARNMEDKLKDFFSKGNLIKIANTIRKYWYIAFSGGVVLFLLGIIANWVARRQARQKKQAQIDLFNTKNEFANKEQRKHSSNGPIYHLPKHPRKGHSSKPSYSNTAIRPLSPQLIAKDMLRRTSLEERKRMD